MQVALVQFDIAWEQRDANHAKVRSLLDHAKPQAGTLIVLPEMFATGFSMNVPAIVDANRATEQFLQQIAKQHRAFVLAGIVQPGSKEKLGRNCAIVIGPEGLEDSSYCKLHPFSMGDEHRHFEAGKHIAAFECDNFTITPLVCYDLRFPEAFRVATSIGANVFCIIANWPRARIQHW
jgi:predicted amidohydrolase